MVLGGKKNKFPVMASKKSLIQVTKKSPKKMANPSNQLKSSKGNSSKQNANKVGHHNSVKENKLSIISFDEEVNSIDKKLSSELSNKKQKKDMKTSFKSKNLKKEMSLKINQNDKNKIYKQKQQKKSIKNGMDDNYLTDAAKNAGENSKKAGSSIHSHRKLSISSTGKVIVAEQTSQLGHEPFSSPQKLKNVQIKSHSKEHKKFTSKYNANVQTSPKPNKAQKPIKLSPECKPKSNQLTKNPAKPALNKYKNTKITTKSIMSPPKKRALEGINDAQNKKMKKVTIVPLENHNSSTSGDNFDKKIPSTMKEQLLKSGRSNKEKTRKSVNTAKNKRLTKPKKEQPRVKNKKKSKILIKKSKVVKNDKMKKKSASRTLKNTVTTHDPLGSPLDEERATLSPVSPKFRKGQSKNKKVESMKSYAVSKKSAISSENEEESEQNTNKLQKASESLNKKGRKKRGRKRIKQEEPHHTLSQTESEGEGGFGNEEIRPIRKRKGQNVYWYIATGFLDDIIDLLMNFEAAPTWSFQEFSKHWVHKKFSLVYRGRQTFKEFLEFSEEVFLWTKKFMLRPHTAKRRVGALYALYGLYYKHPNKQFVQIRLTQSEYKEVLELIKPFINNPENPDPAFCFRKLEVDGAIKHCSTPIELCYEFQNPARNYVEFEYAKEKLVKSSAVTEVLSDHQINSELALMQLYHQVKAVTTGDGANPDRALNLCSTNYIDETVDVIQNMKNETMNDLRLKPVENGKIPVRSRSTNAIPPVDERIMKTIRNRKFVQQLNLQKQIEILRDERVEDVMRNRNSLFFMPQVRKSTKKLTIPYYVPNPGEKLLNKFQAPEKQKRARKRPAAILEGITKRPKKQRNYNELNYKPFGEKSLKNVEIPNKKQCSDGNESLQIITDSENSNQLEDERGNVVSSIKNEIVSATAADVDLISGMLQIRIKYVCDSKVSFKTLKAKVNANQWEDMQKDRERMKRFKNRILPLLGLNKENVVIENITAVPVGETFDDSEFSPSNLVKNSAYWKEEHPIKEEEDDDYLPTSDEEKETEAKDANFDPEEFEEIEDEEEYHVDEYVSDEDEKIYFKSRWYKEPATYRKRKHYSYCFERERVGVLNNDLITPKENTNTKLRIQPIKLEGRTRYITQPTVISSEPECFHSFNDYTTTDKPPPKVNIFKPFGARKNPSAYKIYTILSMKTKAGVPDIPTQSTNNNIELTNRPASRAEDDRVFFEDWIEPEQNASEIDQDSASNLECRL